MTEVDKGGDCLDIGVNGEGKGNDGGCGGGKGGGDV